MSYWPQIVFIGLVIIDVATTRYVVRRVGPDVESNPIWRYGFRHNLLSFQIIYFAGIAAILVLSLYLDDDAFNFAMIAPWVFTAINNLIVVRDYRLRHKR